MRFEVVEWPSRFQLVLTDSFLGRSYYLQATLFLRDKQLGRRSG